jgi:hypothetical protein
LEIQLSRGEVWCRWRFSYQEGSFGAVGDSVIKRGGLVPLEIQLSRGEVWCRWRFSYQEGGFETPLTGSTPPHFCASPKPGPGFPMSYVMVFFVFNEFS